MRTEKSEGDPTKVAAVTINNSTKQNMPKDESNAKVNTVVDDDEPDDW